ncbi:MAG: sulfate permease [Desulfovibrio sp.]|nr:MAG: sulfate permease [Desulfovibrio sp.]
MRFNRMELAGSLGDLGALLPLAAGMILINGLSAPGLFLAVGLFYIIAGLYYRVPIAVQPMKVIAAYAVAQAVPVQEIQAAGLLMALLLLVIGGFNLMAPLAKLVPKPVVRGVQASTGLLLLIRGLELILGTSLFQSELAEPHLLIQALGPVPIGIILGVGFAIIALLLMDSKTLPAGLAVVAGGAAVGAALGAWHSLANVDPGLYLPELLPFGWPQAATFAVAATAMALPQAPMTLGNAVIANADLSMTYFPHGERVTPRALCISMGLANCLSFVLGGMPMCHGAGGLAAHYRFGARTAGSNLIIGGLFLVLALVLGPHVLAAVELLPFSVLGVLLGFAGLELCLATLDVRDRPGLFIIFLMAGLTLATNLAVAFGLGIVFSFAFRHGKIAV